MRFGRNNIVRTVVLVGALCAYPLTRSTVARMYGAPCTVPTGLPGLLMKMGFVPKGNCGTQKDGTCTTPGEFCSSSLSGGQQGHCVVGNGKGTCICSYTK